MGKTQIEKSKTSNRQISSNTKCKFNQIGEKANEHPEWLPDGWNVDFRTRKSGANMGHGYKCYIDPNGNKFYSKPEVLRYLETMKGNSPTSKEEICNTMRSPKNNDAVEKSKVEDLPPEWIVEVKIRKGSNDNRKDLLYTDPVSGYVFRSKKDALRYLESGDISTCAIKPSKRQIQDEPKSTPTSASKKQKLKLSATKRQLFVGKEISDESTLELPDANSLKKGQDVMACSGGMVSSVPTGKSVVKIQSLENAAAYPPKMKKTSDPDDVQEKNLIVNVMENASKTNHNNRSSSKNNELSLAPRFSPRLAGAVPDQLTNNMTNEQTLQVPKRNLRKRNVLDADLANKSFQQHKADNPHSCHGLASEARALKENKLHVGETGKSGLQEIHSNKTSDKKEYRRASKRLAGFEPKLMNNSIYNEIAPEYKSKKSKGEVNAILHQSEGRPAMELTDHASINEESSNKSGKPKISPINNDQLKRLDDEEVNDEKSEPQQSLAFHYSWSDPCLEYTIQSLTGALPVEDSVGNGPTGVPANDIISKTKLFENVTGSSSDKNAHINSKKSKNKKELKMPRRLSKRLAGHEPEVLPPETALEYATRKSCKDKSTATTISTNLASEQLHAGKESKIIVHASDQLKTALCSESSNKSEKSFDAQTIPNEQLQRLEAENIDDDRSEPQLPLQIGDSWSDPCLEFAIKTLTGALPVGDGAADILPVTTPDVNDPPTKELLEKSIKEELNTVCHPSEQLLEQPELRTSFTSCENDPKFATTQSYSNEGNATRNLDGRESLHIEAGNVTQFDINTLFEGPLFENEQVLEGVSVAEQTQPETETANHDNSGREFCVSFMDSWSDPCLDFAFKTLTGTIPVQEDIAIQGCFQEHASCHAQRDGGSMLPEFGSSSISQSDISFPNDIGEKSKTGQQSSTSSSFLPLEKPSLHGFSGVDPQKHYSQCNNNFQRR
ncbi:uncharacterized protein LOC133284277 [Gastrolobium bilobum]|uniref:uncharacterized protein LOC133284277 n=1 Tax=Gastrolobium bilobum TaxID=150636 RepID=UPI002AB2AEC9|nr:uncharacterized protein LOC133284277 [Gastrolobium bilobum]